MGFSEFVNGFANAVFDKAASYDQKEMARKLHCASDYEIEKFLRKSRNGEFSALYRKRLIIVKEGDMM